jgi:hypothetical protein
MTTLRRRSHRLHTGARPRYLVVDRFVDGDGTALDAHRPETGPAWVQRMEALEIQGNRARGTVNNQQHLATVDAGGRAGSFTARAVLRFAYTANSAHGLVLRYAASDDYFLAWVNPGTNTIGLTEAAPGGNTTHASQALANVTIGAGSDYALTVRVAGGRYDVWLGGVYQFSATAGGHEGVAVHGLRTFYRSVAPRHECAVDGVVVW